MTKKSDHTGNQKNQSEVPPVLVPPDAAATEETKPSRTRLLLVLGVGLLLVLGAGAVLFLSPTPLSPPVVQPEKPPQTDSSVPPEPPPVEAESTDAVREEANRLLGDWLGKQAAAEGVNIAAWGGEAYARVVSLARECEHLLAEARFLPAKGACEEAIGTLEKLMDSRDNFLEEALNAGFSALEQGDPKAATDHFQRALAIDADNAQAAKGLRRSASLPEVLRLVEAGQAREQAGDAQGALQSYSEGTSLDPDFLPAREALARVRTAISEQQFQHLMSSALEGLAVGKLGVAGAALEKAETLKPDDLALRDLKNQLFRVRLARKMDSLRRQGESLEKKERWQEALKVCEQALSLDSSAAFAASCRERVSRRIALDSRLRSILSRPERLFSDGPLKNARAVAANAARVNPQGPLLRSQVAQVTQLIRQAEAKVDVVIRSDGLTDVVIYHVGRLGRFQEKRLVLRTGNYTATGSRNGFRDVRQTLKVRPGAGTMEVTLRCEEPI